MSIDRLRNSILTGDAIEQLRTLPDESVHCVVTSPPYWGLRDYGTATWEGGDENHEHRGMVTKQSAPGSAKQASSVGANHVYTGDCACGARRIDEQIGLEATPEQYVESMVEVFREIRRVLRRDGTVWLNLGDSYAANRSYQVTDNKHIDVGNNGAMSVPPGLKPKDLVGIPWRVAFALQADGWWLRSDIIWSKPNPMPESVTDRPTKAHEYIYLLSKSATYYYDADAIREPHVTDGRGGFSNKEALKAVRLNASHAPSLIDATVNDAGRNKRTVWEVATQPYSGAHFATFPEDLIRPCIQAGTSEYGCCVECGAPWERVTEREMVQGRKSGPGNRAAIGDVSPSSVFVTGMEPLTRTTGWRPTCKHEAPIQSAIVLDPFFGSGTTGYVAAVCGRDWIGIELNPQYVELAENRLLRVKARLL